MTQVIANSGDRLDTIVYRHYGTLDYFEAVLAVNPKLSAILKAGDVVLLPECGANEEASEEAKLW